MSVSSALRLLLSAALLLPAGLRHPTAQGADTAASILLRVEGARNRKGRIRVSLFQKADGFPEQSERAVRTASVEIIESSVVVIFDDVPPGEWAIAVLHDQNENGRLDRNFLGIPKEGVGASNDAVRFGQPSFEKARFVVSREGTSVTVKLRYWM